MTDLQEKAMRMALDALVVQTPVHWLDKELHEKAIQALRQALEQPEQKPVGYVTDSGTSAYFLKGVDLDDDTPLYTAPPKRGWVWLTDEEYDELMLSGDWGGSLIQATEAKLKEKNT